MWLTTHRSNLKERGADPYLRGPSPPEWERQASGLDILAKGEAAKLVFTLVDQKEESTEQH